jgi:hypothetical protein
MDTLQYREGGGREPAKPAEAEDQAVDALLAGLDLPKEVSTLEAAAILACCKHTVLQYRLEGLLEWRDAAPPSSNRPVYRFTLRSVLELRLGYRRGEVRPPRPPEEGKRRRQAASTSAFKPKHLRRQKQKRDDDASSDR